METKPLTQSVPSSGHPHRRTPLLLSISSKGQKNQVKPQKSTRIQAPPWPLAAPAMAKIQAPPTSPNWAKTNKSYSTPSKSIISLIYTTVSVLLISFFSLETRMVFCQLTAIPIKSPTKLYPISRFQTKKVKHEVLLPISPLVRSRRQISTSLSRSDSSSIRRKKKKKKKKRARLRVGWWQGSRMRPGYALADWVELSLDVHLMTGWWQGPRPRPGSASKFRTRTRLRGIGPNNGARWKMGK